MVSVLLSTVLLWGFTLCDIPPVEFLWWPDIIWSTLHIARLLPTVYWKAGVDCDKLLPVSHCGRCMHLPLLDIPSAMPPRKERGEGEVEACLQQCNLVVESFGSWHEDAVKEVEAGGSIGLPVSAQLRRSRQ